MAWPKRGVYFFRENGENRSDTGTGLRVVRVGTHAITSGSGTKLWQRLSQHKGIARTGGGNHRGSIFRLLVGTALINRDGYVCNSWGHKDMASAANKKMEEPLEIEVSNVVGNMPFLWLAAEDEAGPDSLRGYIERNSIALLSNLDKTPIDAPSANWLGSHCDKVKVCRSGLWNQKHTAENYDTAFLTELEKLILRMQTAP